MDVPEFSNVEEVIDMANDKENWQIEANCLQYKSKTESINNKTESDRSRLNNTTITHSYNLRSRK